MSLKLAEVAAVHALLSAATPAPWFLSAPYLDDEGIREIPVQTKMGDGTYTPAAVFLQFPNARVMQDANAALIVWLRNNAALLLDALTYVRTQDAALDRITRRARLALAGQSRDRDDWIEDVEQIAKFASLIPAMPANVRDAIAESECPAQGVSE